MSAHELRARLRATLVDLSRSGDFADSDDVFASGLVGSMNLIELVTSVEDSYGFEVTERDIFEGHLRSVDRLVALVLDRRPPR